MQTIACCVIYMAYCPQSLILHLELGHQARHNIVSAASWVVRNHHSFYATHGNEQKSTPPKSSRKSALSPRDSDVYMVLRIIKEEWVCESLYVSPICCDLCPYMWLMKDYGEDRCPERGGVGKESTLKTYIIFWCKFLSVCTCTWRFNTRTKE